MDPDEAVQRLGSDTVRMYLAFVGPYNEVSTYPWNPDGVVGVRRFLERVWKTTDRIAAKPTQTLEPILHKTIKKVGEDITALKFNTAISALMIFLNAVDKEGSIGKEQYKTLLCLIAPFAPHMAEELWGKLGHHKTLAYEPWPIYDPACLVEDQVEMAVLIGGKVRAKITVSNGMNPSEIEKFVLADSKVTAWTEGKTIVKVIVVPGRTVNIVIK